MLLVLALVAGASVCLEASAPLRSVSEIRALNEWAESEPHPIDLIGVVTHFDASRQLLVLQDTEGPLVFDLGATKLNFFPGQRVRLKASDSRPFLPHLPRYPDLPDRHEWLSAFEHQPERQTNFYIDRFRGWVHPPVTGLYHFSIASDDSSQLLLGTDQNPASKRCVAKVESYTRVRDWNRTAPQCSEALLLEAGKAYYIEAVHHQAEGPSHVSVAWEGPGIPLAVIPGSFLSPFAVKGLSGVLVPTNPAAGPSGGLLRELWSHTSVGDVNDLLAPRLLKSVLTLSDISVEVFGEGSLPKPLRMQPGIKISDSDHFRWAEMEGTVDFAAWDGEQLTLELSDQGQRFEAVLSGWKQGSPDSLRGRRVRVIGAAESIWQDGMPSTLSRIWLHPSSGMSFTHQAPQTELARLTTILELNLSPKAFQNLAVKFHGKVVSQEGSQLVLSDQGSFSAFTSEDGRVWQTVGKPIELAMPSKIHVGLVVSSRTPSALSRAVFSAVKGLSENASLLDLGNPTAAGRLNLVEGRYLIDGVGNDIWDSPDQFSFVHQELEGEGSIIARLDSFSPADPAARAGLMMRESFAPSSQFVDLVQTTEEGVFSAYLQWRWLQAGSSTRSVPDSSLSPSLPKWLKLERKFNTVQVSGHLSNQFKPGEQVAVVGYVSADSGPLRINDALVSPASPEQPNLPNPLAWRPLREIANLGDANNRWGGLDFFRFRGVVTFCGEVLGKSYWAVQDASAGTLLSGRSASNHFRIQPGTQVEVFSHPGWAPPTNTLYADDVFSLGPSAFPKPVRHPAEYLQPKRGEGTWIELEGIVRAVAEAGLLELKVRGELFTVAVSGASASSLRPFIDASVRLRGVIVYPNERERLLLVPSAAHLDLLEPAPVNLFALPLETPRTLSEKVLLNQSRHRVRLRGSLSFADSSVLYLQDDSSGAARIELETSVPLSLGTSLEVAGFPDWGEDDCVVLRHAEILSKASGSEVQATLLGLNDAAESLSSGRLLTVRGRLSQPYTGTESEPLWLEAGQQLYRVELSAYRSSLPALPQGSLLELTGIRLRAPGLLQSVQSPGTTAPQRSLRLLLRRASDLVVLEKPSWWVLQRALVVLSLAAFAMVLVSVWIHRLRLRVRQRTAELAGTMDQLRKETHRSATLAERDRLAGEIHDSLEQGLNGLLLQLESTANQESCPPDISAGLKLACNMARFSRTEVQYAVWELQSPLLEDSELPVAIEKIMRQITPASIEGQVRNEGTPRRLPSVIEHHLLRIAQEAINNTVKHASARSVEVLLRYEPDAVSLSITDDGCGFDPAKVRTGGLGRFGLRSLRSRVGKIRGTLDLLSAPGKGTTLRVRVSDTPQPSP